MEKKPTEITSERMRIGQRQLPKIPAQLLYGMGAVFALLFMYTAFRGQFTPVAQRALLLVPGIVVALIYFPLLKKKPRGWTLIVDGILALIAVLAIVWTSYKEIAAGIELTPVNNFDRFVTAILVLTLLEATRRVVGNTMVIIVVGFLAYGFVGPWMPGFLCHGGFPWWQILDYLSYGTSGIFGLPLGVCASMLVLFVVFAAFLRISGGGEWFIKFPFSLFGGTRGGPAKMAVVASSLFGSLSGSATANVAGTGTFTIPLMKRMGYEPKVAGAIEALASTGGCIMPPVMGAAAFIMADVLGVSYWSIAIAAFIPAALYYVGLFAVVDFEAAKHDIKGLPRSELPPRLKTLAEGWFLLIPLVVLIYLLANAFSPLYACAVTIIVTVIVSQFTKRTRMGPKKIYDSLAQGMEMMTMVTIICAVAGIVIGIVGLTGLASRLSELLIIYSHGFLPMLLLITMVTSLVFGMGMPMSACYIFLALLVAPALVYLGILPLAAHLFVLYFGALSCVTPPVATAAYAGAAIAGSKPFETGFTAWRLGLIAYIVPFFFVYNPCLLLIGSVGEVVLAVVTAIVGAYLFASALQGYLFRKAGVFERVILGVAALLLISPGWYTMVIGLGFGALGVLLNWRRKRALPGETGVPGVFSAHWLK